MQASNMFCQSPRSRRCCVRAMPGSVYFAVNGENLGPAGVGPSVVKNVVMAPTDLKADLTRLPI